MLEKASLLSLLLAFGLGQVPVTPTPRDHKLFRASLTATVVMDSPSDSSVSGCRLVAIEWRPLPGTPGYQVQVRVGGSNTWVAAGADTRCGGGGPAGAAAFRDRVPLRAPRRFYRVIALAADGHSLDVTKSVPVDVR